MNFRIEFTIVAFECSGDGNRFGGLVAVGKKASGGAMSPGPLPRYGEQGGQRWALRRVSASQVRPLCRPPLVCALLLFRVQCAVPGFWHICRRAQMKLRIMYVSTPFITGVGQSGS